MSSIQCTPQTNIYRNLYTYNKSFHPQFHKIAYKAQLSIDPRIRKKIRKIHHYESEVGGVEEICTLIRRRNLGHLLNELNTKNATKKSGYVYLIVVTLLKISPQNLKNTAIEWVSTPSLKFQI